MLYQREKKVKSKRTNGGKSNSKLQDNSKGNECYEEAILSLYGSDLDDKFR